MEKTRVRCDYETGKGYVDKDGTRERVSSVEGVSATDQQIDVRVTGSGGASDAAETGGIVSAERIGDDGWFALLASGGAEDVVGAGTARDFILTELRDFDDLDLATGLKRAFRSANQAIYSERAETPVEGVSAIALLTNGKNASLALVGDHRAYLYRANRMTQLTRDQRVYRATSRRKQDIERAGEHSKQQRETPLLGTSERLDSRTPAIFEISLLPEDKLALVSENVYSTLGDEEMERIVSGDAEVAAHQLAADAARLSQKESSLAAVLSVAPAREPRAELVTGTSMGLPWIPATIALIAVLVVVVIVVALVL